MKATRSLWRRIASWTQIHKRLVFGSAGVLLIAIIAAQLFYPEGRSLPGAQIQGVSTVGKSYEQIVEQVQTDFAASEVELRTKNIALKKPLSHIGAEPETEQMAKVLTDYPLWQRFVPFSLFVKRPHLETMVVAIDEAQLASAAESLANELSDEPENARLAIVDGTLAITPAKIGQSVKVSGIADTLKKNTYLFGVTTVTVPGDETPPAITDEDIAPVRTQAEEIVKRTFRIVAANGQEFTADQGTITSWLVVVDGTDGKPVLQADREHIKAYITSINEKVGTKPGTAQATMVDGVETARTEAPSGLAIASEEFLR